MTYNVTQLTHVNHDLTLNNIHSHFNHLHDWHEYCYRPSNYHASVNMRKHYGILFFLARTLSHAT